MRTLEGSNRIRNGVVGIIIVILVIGVGQSFASVPMLFAQPTYYGQFTDSGGLTRRRQGADRGHGRRQQSSRWPSTATTS